MKLHQLLFLLSILQLIICGCSGATRTFAGEQVFVTVLPEHVLGCTYIGDFEAEDKRASGLAAALVANIDFQASAENMLSNKVGQAGGNAAIRQFTYHSGMEGAGVIAEAYRCEFDPRERAEATMAKGAPAPSTDWKALSNTLQDGVDGQEQVIERLGHPLTKIPMDTKCAKQMWVYSRVVSGVAESVNITLDDDGILCSHSYVGMEVPVVEDVE